MVAPGTEPSTRLGTDDSDVVGVITMALKLRLSTNREICDEDRP